MTTEEKIPQDELTQRITQRLAARQKKLERMQQWERPARRLPVQRIALLAAAACVALVFLVLPQRSGTSFDEAGMQPDLTAFRSATPLTGEIQQLLEAEEYETALARTERALWLSDSTLALPSDTLMDEEALYEVQLERSMNEALRWTHICLLVKTERRDAARHALEQYLEVSENEARKVLATRWLEVLKEKK